MEAYTDIYQSRSDPPTNDSPVRQQEYPKYDISQN